jgi:hypothetical protein
MEWVFPRLFAEVLLLEMDRISYVSEFGEVELFGFQEMQ